MRRSFWAPLGGIVAVAVSIRVLYTVLVAPWPPEASDDQVYFNLMPKLLADGRGFIQPQLHIAGIVRPTAAHPPFYSVVLAGLAELGATDQLLQRLAGTVFGAGTVLLVALIGRRLAGPRAGLIAAALAALYPILITADGALMSESLYGLLVAGALLLTLRLLDRPGPAPWWLAAALGVVCGLAALTRGEALLLAPLLLVPAVRRPGGLRTAAVTCVATVLVLAPWTIRNVVTFDHLVLISTDAGAVVGGANCASTYSGPNIGGWDITCDPVYPGNEAQQTTKQLHKGLTYANDHLRRVPVVVGARLARQFSLRLPWQTNSGRDPGWQNAGTIMFYALVPFGVAGFLVLRRRRVQTWTIAVPVMLAVVMAAVIYGFLRFRHPADIALVVLAGVAIDALARRSSTRPATAPAATGTPARPRSPVA
jgi:4-amino-4-deoxy-L-arabinose transferase-like glycosyltransferase